MVAILPVSSRVTKFTSRDCSSNCHSECRKIEASSSSIFASPQTSVSDVVKIRGLISINVASFFMKQACSRSIISCKAKLWSSHSMYSASCSPAELAFLPVSLIRRKSAASFSSTSTPPFLWATSSMQPSDRLIVSER
ncbi:hypothetical protein D3C85_1334770 [compost metagenome]